MPGWAWSSPCRVGSELTMPGWARSSPCWDGSNLTMPGGLGAHHVRVCTGKHAHAHTCQCAHLLLICPLHLLCLNHLLHCRRCSSCGLPDLWLLHSSQLRQLLSQPSSGITNQLWATNKRLLPLIHVLPMHTCSICFICRRSLTASAESAGAWIFFSRACRWQPQGHNRSKRTIEKVSTKHIFRYIQIGQDRSPLPSVCPEIFVEKVHARPSSRCVCVPLSGVLRL